MDSRVTPMVLSPPSMSPEWPLPKLSTLPPSLALWDMLVILMLLDMPLPSLTQPLMQLAMATPDLLQEHFPWLPTQMGLWFQLMSLLLPLPVLTTLLPRVPSLLLLQFPTLLLLLWLLLPLPSLTLLGMLVL